MESIANTFTDGISDGKFAIANSLQHQNNRGEKKFHSRGHSLSFPLPSSSSHRRPNPPHPPILLSSLLTPFLRHPVATPTPLAPSPCRSDPSAPSFHSSMPIAAPPLPAPTSPDQLRGRPDPTGLDSAAAPTPRAEPSLNSSILPPVTIIYFVHVPSSPSPPFVHPAIAGALPLLPSFVPPLSKPSLPSFPPSRHRWSPPSPPSRHRRSPPSPPFLHPITVGALPPLLSSVLTPPEPSLSSIPPPLEPSLSFLPLSRHHWSPPSPLSHPVDTARALPLLHPATTGALPPLPSSVPPPPEPSLPSSVTLRMAAHGPLLASGLRCVPLCSVGPS